MDINSKKVEKSEKINADKGLKPLVQDINSKKVEKSEKINAGKGLKPLVPRHYFKQKLRKGEKEKKVRK